MAARSLSSRRAMMCGAFASVVGMGLLATAVARHDIACFLSAMVMAGAGYSLLFLSALEVLNAVTPALYRGGVLSALYVLAYLSMGSVAVLLGMVATAHGLALAIDLGAASIASLSLITLVLAVAVRRPDSSPETPSPLVLNVSPCNVGQQAPLALAPTMYRKPRRVWSVGRPLSAKHNQAPCAQHGSKAAGQVNRPECAMHSACLRPDMPLSAKQGSSAARRLVGQRTFKLAAALCPAWEIPRSEGSSFLSALPAGLR